MTRIRRALEGEAAALTAIATQAKAHWGYTGAQLAAWREDLTIHPGTIAACPTYVAEEEGGLVGFFCLAPAPVHWTLEHLWVLPSDMGKGVGRALLARAVVLAREGGADAIAIDADPNAEPFYLACGARRVGALAAPLEGQANRVRPQLLLPAAPAFSDERESVQGTLAFATLGPAGSNHELVTRRYADFLGLAGVRIELVTEFAAAVDLLRDGRVDCIVQCAAHPDVAWTVGANRAFLFVIDTFIAPGRPLGILTRTDVAAPSTIAFHPATRSYANLDRWEHHVEEQSTVAVAEGLLSGRYDSGIAALEVADAHPGRLRIDATIGAVDDAWIVYGPMPVCENGLVAWPGSPGARWLRERAARR